MRKSLLMSAAFVAALAGCSQAGEPIREASDVHEEPNISPTSAPGVAWQYSYNYQLRDEAISGVQEAHATACETLGPARCRITGLNYSVSEDETVSAMLQVKLAPEIAREFGKGATGQVGKAGGKLLSTEITGEDVTPVSSQAASQQKALNGQIADLEKQLARATSASERNALNSRLGELRGQLTYARSTIAEATEKLASTPMTFNYYGKGGIAGFAGHNPAMDAARSFVSSLVAMITIVLQLLAWVLPWAILGFVIFLAARSRAASAFRGLFKPSDDIAPGQSSE